MSFRVSFRGESVKPHRPTTSIRLSDRLHHQLTEASWEGKQAAARRPGTVLFPDSRRIELAGLSTADVFRAQLADGPANDRVEAYSVKVCLSGIRSFSHALTQPSNTGIAYPIR
jgi:hypothetical protein